MNDPADHLAELLAAFLMDRPVPSNVRGWFLDGTLRALRRGEALELGLGLSGVGRRNLQWRYMERLRDRYLCEALALVSLDPQLTTWHRSLRLAPLVDKFVAFDWPRSKRLSVPPTDWPGYKVALWHAARTGRDLPLSPHALKACAARKVGYSRNGSSHVIEQQITP
jgi:hypothetical protein